MELSTAYLGALFSIFWINLLLSGDNAVVIAMACRSLPEKKRNIGIILGAAVAIILRIIFTFIVTILLNIPYLKLIGGLLLLWIAIKLVVGEDNDEADIQASDNLWRAVSTIAVADTVMSLDNVMAIAGIAGNNYSLLIIGLIMSIPLVIAGASIVSKLITMFPIVVWAGAALLGWIAGNMMAEDKAFNKMLHQWPEHNHYVLAVAGAIIVLAIGFLWKRQIEAKHKKAVH